MFKNNFERRVGLGFAIIIFLLLVSGLSSLWFLHEIRQSSLHVTETAVPVVKGSNKVQIQLLKLAKLSSLAFTREDKSQLLKYQSDFEQGVGAYQKQFRGLEGLTRSYPSMAALVSDVKDRDADYIKAVRHMFTAKLDYISNREQVNKEAKALNDLIDQVGGSLDNIAYAYDMPPKGHKEDMKRVEGFAEYANQLLLATIKTIREVRGATKPAQLSTSTEDLLSAIRDSRLRLDAAARIFNPWGKKDLVPAAYAAFAALKDRVNAKDNLVTYKKKELESLAKAREDLGSSDKAVSHAIASLDKLHELANKQFNSLQGKVFSALSAGFKSSLVILVVLILLATQNFNSMRKAIRRKMRDLAQLNSIGQALASAQTREAALEEVLQSMHRKTGVAQGSVYLTNEKDELEVKAYFPPKVIEEGSRPTKFATGKGIIGKAADTRKIIFVPNTLEDKNYVPSENEQARSLLCVPLVDKEVLLGVINLSGNARNVTFADSDYEFVASVAQSLVTTIKNIHLRETIEEYNRTLEEKVRERTAALQQKNRDIASMMANMHQGLFTIVTNGNIHPEYSAFLESIFETNQIAHRKFSDVMFNNARLSADEIDQCIAAVSTIVGEDEMMFDFNSHCLPGEMTLVLDEGRQKILEMDWNPILSDDGEVEKLMVAVRDVTELKALEAEANRQREELEIIGEILGVDADKFRDFLSVSSDFLGQCRELIEKTPDKDPEIIANLFRNMHTVKGNARTYGLKQIAEKVHVVEQTYDDLRKNEELAWVPDQLLRELEEVREIVEQYAMIFGEKLGGNTETDHGMTIDRERIDALLREIRAIDTQAIPAQVQRFMRNTYSTLVQVEAKPTSVIIRDVITSVKSLARNLGKPEPHISIDDGDAFIKREIHSTLHNIFMHVFSNAIDHGIESPQERQDKGKPEAGRIAMTVSGEDRQVMMEIRDDGRGIAITKIFEKAKEKGIYAPDAARPSAQEIANLIFSSGFSTADQVSDVSGRGVGMDAVRDFLRSRGGNIEVVLDPGDERADFRNFVTRITLPGEYAIVMPHFDMTA